jgi:Xaa-Pro aminopeptidase
MNDMAQRVNGPVSSAELERRWAAIRLAMRQAGVDVLVMQNNSEEVGGYVKYVTDIPASGYANTVIFPAEAEMTVIVHGPAAEQTLGDGGDGVFRGVERILSSPYFPSVSYTSAAAGELALRALGGYERATIGLVGTAQMSLSFGDVLRQGLATATFVEASELVDRVKAIKSAEEQQLIRDCAHMQDAVMRATLDAIEPGMRESDVAAVARHTSWSLGSEAGVLLVGSGRAGGGWVIAPRHLQNRVIEEGDMVAVLVELNGPGGLYTELGRTAVLGEIPPRLEAELELVLEAQRFTLQRLVPGASCSDVWEEYNAFLADRGRPPEARLHCHGQGVDLVERPLVRFDETMTIQAGMSMTCHPTWMQDGLWSWTCDNYLIGPDGPGACLHAFPAGIVAR